MYSPTDMSVTPNVAKVDFCYNILQTPVVLVVYQ